MYKAKCDFLWYLKGKEVPEQDVEDNPNWLRFVEVVGESKPKPKKSSIFDLNGDGKFDKKDVKIAAKAMSKWSRKKRK